MPLLQIVIRNTPRILGEKNIYQQLHMALL